VCANIGVLPLPVIATAVLILSTLVLATQASRDDDAVEVFLREFIAMDDATSPEIDLPASFPGNDVENYLELSADPCTEPSMQFDGVDYFGNDLRTGIGSADSAACPAHALPTSGVRLGHTAPTFPSAGSRPPRAPFKKR